MSEKSDRTIIIVTKGFEPICKTSPEKAFCLLYSGKAVGHEFTDPELNKYAVLRSAYEEWHVPKVIILKTNFDISRILRRGYIHPSKKHVLMRDSYSCAYCGNRATTLDHIIPTSKGGKNVWENLVAACAKCNNMKGDKNLEEINLKLRFKPRALTPYELTNKIMKELMELIEKDQTT